jgi:4-carboxymuconolactone decarboxylase
MDQAYEWNSHENTARMIGVDPKVIDVIKNFKDAKSLPEKERMVIEWGRTLFREHTVKPELFQRMVGVFGQKGMYEVTSLMSDYMFAAVLLHAVDQHKTPDAKYDLPKRKLPAARTIAAVAPTRTGYPADIDASSLSRLPLLKCADFKGDEQKVCQAVAGANRPTAAQGPPATSLYSLPVAEAMDLMNRYLGRAAIGARAFQLASVVGSREFDQQYEYSAHDPAALRNGVPQSTVDIIKFNKPIPASLGSTPEDAKDLAILRAGRQLFQQHKLDSDAWAQLVTHFGKQGALDVVASMADYAMVGLMLNAVDQQVPLERPLVMPLRQ